MKLYYSPGACSMASHIALVESGLKYTTTRVDLATHKVDGKDYYRVNPKGYVPALELEDGEVLTENAVILQYIADQAPKAKLLPAAGSLERFRSMEWLNFIATEIHKGFSPLWNKNLSADIHTWAREKLATRFDFLSEKLKGKKYLVGDSYTVADAYLFTILSWSTPLKVDLTKWPVLLGYLEGVKSRTATHQALKEEGLSR